MVTKVENIPAELKNVHNWVCWAGNDKIPKNPATGKNAQSNNPKSWGTFAQAVKACETFHFDGIGFMFAPPYFGVDLDHCLDKVDFCDEFVETLQSYAEISMSGSGLHIICKGKLPAGSRRKGGVEMYSQGRYFACTGNIYNEKYTQIIDCTESIKLLHSKYLPTDTPKIETKTFVPLEFDDSEIIDKARNCKSGYLFAALYDGSWQGAYPSQSEADLAFCNMLAFWTQKNAEQMDRIFRCSGLMRPKWDRKTGSMTYGQITIGKAIANCGDVYDPQRHTDETALAFSVFKSGEMKVEMQTKNYDMTDTGNAHRLYDKYADVLRYSYNRKKWYYWDSKCWRLDESGEVKKLADEICEDLKKEAFMEQDEEMQDKKLKWASRTASSKNKESMIKECQHLDKIPASPESFDAYTNYLNVQNGIVNLRNGELLPHDPNFMMSKICFSEYDVERRKPELWLSFLNDVTNGDKELQKYIQKCVGYSISGSNSEQCAYFLYGVGNNGKSTFLDTIADILGTYAANTQPESIMLKRFGNDTANSDIARLKSSRFVTCEEPTEGVRLNEGLLKQLTGGSKITCRFLYGDEFEYTPEFKIWIATNHKPVIRGTDIGIWRRIKLIPFEVNIPADKVDKNLKYKLRKEAPQILAWAVQGCILWQKEGIQEPDCVLDAVKEYKQEMDLLATFIEQCIVIDYENKTSMTAQALFQLYMQWAKQNNEYEMSSNKFFREIGKRLPEKKRTGAGILYPSIRVTDYAGSLLSDHRQYDFNKFLGGDN